MLRVGELTERGMLTASIRPRNALRLKGLVPLLLGLARRLAGTKTKSALNLEVLSRSFAPI